MDSHVALYRKYRPRGFEELIGQRHISHTLTNAIAANKVSHAYLFTGSRGTGKTTAARIIAKALNCEQGPTGNPCGHCAACRRINDGQSLDVVEMDAATNRGIDDVRELREKVRLAPVQERVKVYIIDEVHQLTGEAFNALLKTLEEPPRNVIFVLATTDLNKVPATIVSRCQRFDFRRGSMADLVRRLQYVANGEGWTLEDEAAKAIAAAAQGGYRDALSLLEQVSAFTGGGTYISVNDALLVIGGVHDDLMMEAMHAIITHDAALGFRVARKAIQDGVEPRTFFEALRKKFRDLLALSYGADHDVVVMDKHRSTLAEMAKVYPQDYALWALSVLNYAEQKLGWGLSDIHIVLETTLFSIATLDGQITTPVNSRHEVERDAREAMEGRGPEPDDSPAIVAPPQEVANTAVEEGTPRQATDSRPADPDLASFAAAWSRFCGQVPPNASDVLRRLRPVRRVGDTLIVAGEDRDAVRQSIEKSAVLEGMFAQVSGRRVKLDFQLALDEFS